MTALLRGTVTIANDESVSGSGYARDLYDEIAAVETAYKTLPSLEKPLTIPGPLAIWTAQILPIRLRILRAWAREATRQSLLVTKLLGTATGWDEVASITSVSATLEDITGLSFTIVIPTGETGKIQALMTVACSATGGSPVTGAWAVSVNSTDGTEMPRYMSGTNDAGSLTVQCQSVQLAAGTYTVKGRHRRVSGAGTVSSDVAQLSARAVIG